MISRRYGLNEEQVVLFEKTKEIPYANKLPKMMSTLLTFMFNQALGVPTGDHGSFNV